MSAHAAFTLNLFYELLSYSDVFKMVGKVLGDFPISQLDFRSVFNLVVEQSWIECLVLLLKSLPPELRVEEIITIASRRSQAIVLAGIRLGGLQRSLTRRQVGELRVASGLEVLLVKEGGGFARFGKLNSQFFNLQCLP